MKASGCEAVNYLTIVKKSNTIADPTITTGAMQNLESTQCKEF